MPRPVRVLGVDDSLTMRKLLEVVFTAPTYELTLALTGAEAIAAVTRTQPDIVVMDYVLPDMRGIDICVSLSRSPATASIPIVVTSAKGAKVLDEFKSYSAVVGFVPKPFKPADLRAVVVDALRERAKPDAAATAPRAPAPAASAAAAAAPIATVPAGSAAAGPSAPRPARADAPKLAHAELEKLARSLFTALSPVFSKVPEWLHEMGSERPERFLAKKALTAKTIESLLEAVQPFVAPSETQSSEFSGSTDFVPLVELCALVARERRTGTLQLTRDGASIHVFVRHGELVAATHSDPAVYLAATDSPAWKLTPEQRRRAFEAHKKSGVPALVTFAECGGFPIEQLASCLKSASSHTLTRALDETWRFRWSSGALPTWADAHGTSVSIQSLRLVHLRRREDGDGSAEWAPSQLLLRAPGFTEHVRALELDADERTVLTLVNNRYHLRDVVEKSGLAPARVGRIVQRLAKVGLILGAPNAGAPTAGATSSVREASRRKVVLFEPDRRGVVPALTHRIGTARSGRDVVVAESPGELLSHVDAALEALIVNCSAKEVDAAQLARKVRESLEVAGATLIALVEPHDGARVAALKSAGFDGVLVKPFLLDELDALLAAA
ncbi:MAG: response regulator [Planctomycetes bacterium]|nr:response regulator [Planctomycetota bacterium]